MTSKEFYLRSSTLGIRVSISKNFKAAPFIWRHASLTQNLPPLLSVTADRFFTYTFMHVTDIPDYLFFDFCFLTLFENSKFYSHFVRMFRTLSYLCKCIDINVAASLYNVIEWSPIDTLHLGLISRLSIGQSLSANYKSHLGSGYNMFFNKNNY